MAPSDDKYTTFYLMIIVMFALCFAIYEKFVNQIRRQSLTLKVKVKVMDGKNGISAIPLEMFASVQLNFSEFREFKI